MNDVNNIIDLHKIVNKDKIKKNIDIGKIENDLVSMKKIEKYDSDKELTDIIKACKTETNQTNNNKYDVLQKVINKNKEKEEENSDNELHSFDDSEEQEINDKVDNDIYEKPIKKYKGEDFMTQCEKVGPPDFVSEYYGDRLDFYKKITNLKVFPMIMEGLYKEYNRESA